MARKLNILISVNVLLLIFGYIVFRTYAEYNARAWVDKAIAAVSGAAVVEVKGVNVNLLDSYINLANIDISPIRGEGDSLPVSIHIDEAVLYDVDREHLLPRIVHISFIGVEIEFDHGSPLGARLKALGYEKLFGTADIDYIYDPEKRELLLKEFTQSIDGMGTLTVKTKLSSIDIEAVLRAGLSGMDGSLLKATINDIEMHYKDDSLVSRLVRVGATTRGEAAASYRKLLEVELKAILLVAGSALDGESASALIDFFKYPQSRKLSVTALPRTLVSLGEIDIKDPLGTAKMLSAVVSSTERKPEEVRE